MNLIQILDSDHLRVVKIDSDPLLDEYDDVFESKGLESWLDITR